MLASDGSGRSEGDLIYLNGKSSRKMKAFSSKAKMSNCEWNFTLTYTHSNQ